MYVVDASVHVAGSRLQEPNHAEARALLARLAAERQIVYLPEIVLAEVAAMRRTFYRPVRKPNPVKDSRACLLDARPRGSRVR